MIKNLIFHFFKWEQRYLFQSKIPRNFFFLFRRSLTGLLTLIIYPCAQIINRFLVVHIFSNCQMNSGHFVQLSPVFWSVPSHICRMINNLGLFKAANDLRLGVYKFFFIHSHVLTIWNLINFRLYINKLYLVTNSGFNRDCSWVFMWWKKCLFVRLALPPGSLSPKATIAFAEVICEPVETFRSVISPSKTFLIFLRVWNLFIANWFVVHIFWMS